MWFLEHESLFGGKRVWLRPGSQQLFGRTKSGDKDGQEGKTWKIENKAVSRKHVMLKVLEAPPQQGTKLHARSQIEVTDLSCRQGTTVDDNKVLKSQKGEDGSIAYDKAVLTGTEHSIRLAQGYAPFKIVWRAAVFTYASKETKEGKARSAQLHVLDIKTTTEFQFDKTTHVISQKRNLPKVLSGLTAGKHIVTADFIDAVVTAAITSVDGEGSYIPSRLEEDFDLWWPKEKEYVPPIGAEPVPRPQEMLEPDITRSEVFSGLTFIFLNDSQYSSLLEPITGGGAKALLYDVRPGETTVQEYVDYVHSVAGKKRNSRESNEKPPVVTVRLPAFPDAMEAWAATFVTGVDQVLGQRSVLQNEFLDVIITKDRASLQRPPVETNGFTSTAPQPTSTSAQPASCDSTAMSKTRGSLQAPDSAAVPAEEPAKINPRKRIHRPKTTSRFTGFDDFEPPSKKTKLESIQTEDVQESARSIISIAASQAQAVGGAQSHALSQSQAHDTVEKEEQIDTLFPTAAKVRRQRAATRAPAERDEPEMDEPVQKPKSKGTEALERLQRARAKGDKEIDVREQTRLRLKSEEDRQKANEDRLREALAGIDIAEMKNLAPIEEMDVLPREHRGNTRDQGQVHSERWDSEWNGRKNFKKFRRRGAEHGVQAHKVIVILEEAPPKKGFGIGNAFYLEDVEPSSRSRGKGRTQDRESSDAEPGFTRRKRTTQTEVVNVEDSGPDDEEDPEDRTQKSSGRTERVIETQVGATQTQTQGGKKRRSGSITAEQPASKRGRIGRRDDDSDEEETGFRFKRRG